MVIGLHIVRSRIRDRVIASFPNSLSQAGVQIGTNEIATRPGGGVEILSFASYYRKLQKLL